MERIVNLCKLFLSVTVVLLSSASGAHAQAAAKSVTIKYAGMPTPDFLPLYTWRDKGFFRRENLDIDLLTFPTGDKMTVALISGSVDIASYTPDSFIRAMEKGDAPIKIFMGHSNVPVYSLVVQKDINSYGDLKGKRIAVSSIKASDAYFVRKMMAAKGLQERDYVLIQVGSSIDRAAALSAGSVSGTLIIPPLDQKVVDEGHKRLDVTSNVIDRYARKIYEMYFESKNVTVDKDGDLDIAGLQAVIDAMADLGDFKPPVPRVEKYVDLSYWREAVKSIR